MALLTAEEKELLTKAVSLMNRLLKTLEIMQDKKLVKDRLYDNLRLDTYKIYW